MKTPQGSSIHSLNDTIEFSHFDGPGFILMNAARVPRFTAKMDDAFLLIPEDAQWSIASTGLVKAEWKGKKFREKLWSPEFGVCAVGLAIQLAMREED